MMSMKMRIGVKMRIGKKKKTSSDDNSSSSSSSPLKQAEVRSPRWTTKKGEELGMKIWSCLGLPRRARKTICRYEDDYSVILNTWLEQLREAPRKEEARGDGGGFRLRKRSVRGGGADGFRLRKCSVHIKQGSLKAGDRVNLSQILFTKNRDFLVTYNDRDRPVKAKHLKGKVVILHFVPLKPWDWILMRSVLSFVDIYDAIKPKGVEVIFVGVTTPDSPQDSSSLKECFEEKFSVIPWTAIPFSSDIVKSQKYLEKKLRYPFSRYVGASQTVSLVIDPAGVVLHLNAADYIFEYGARAYPFSDERIQSLWYEDEEALKHPSITKLLTTPQLNYVINQQNQKVPVRDLEDKVVAFYFYDNYELNDLTQELKRAYEQLAYKDNFEIVLVYIHDSLDAYVLETEESFWDIFHTMPWLALPFRDPRSKYLKRVFCLPLSLDDSGPDPRLLIIGPQGRFVEPCGVDILQNYGISAYPFNRKRVAELEAEYTRKLKVDMILDNTLFIQKGYKVKPSQLKGKRILFLIDDGTATIYTNFCSMLKERYLLMKDTEDEFEVIHVPNSHTNSAFRGYVATMPWLTCSPSHLQNKDFLRRLFRRGVGLLAFDGDGRVVRRAMWPSIEKGNMDFPFYAGSLESEAFTELIDFFDWDRWLVQGWLERVQ